MNELIFKCVHPLKFLNWFNYFVLLGDKTSHYRQKLQTHYKQKKNITIIALLNSVSCIRQPYKRILLILAG